MKQANEIYKAIDAETEACVEKKYSFWKFQPRHKLKPKCYAEALQRHQSELSQAQAVNYTLEQQINKKTIEALNNQPNPYQNLAILIIAILIIYLIFY
jgi:hypothetical protein